MDNILIYPAGTSDSCRYAARFLKQEKIPIVDHPTPEVTHVLLDVPTNPEEARKILPMVPVDVTVVGGNLSGFVSGKNRVVDLLKNEHYLAANAAITADCAIKVVCPLMKSAFADSPALVIGWGRIGKCLAQKLSGLGCPVTVAVRKEKDLAALRSLGYEAVDIRKLPPLLPKFRLIFNTAPEAVLAADQLSLCGNCIKIDLASLQGLPGDDVLWARKLPGKYAPESAGKLMAKTLLQYIKEVI